MSQAPLRLPVVTRDRGGRGSRAPAGPHSPILSVLAAAVTAPAAQRLGDEDVPRRRRHNLPRLAHSQYGVPLRLHPPAAISFARLGTSLSLSIPLSVYLCLYRYIRHTPERGKEGTSRRCTVLSTRVHTLRRRVRYWRYTPTRRALSLFPSQIRTRPRDSLFARGAERAARIDRRGGSDALVVGVAVSLPRAYTIEPARARSRRRCRKRPVITGLRGYDECTGAFFFTGNTRERSRMGDECREEWRDGIDDAGSLLIRERNNAVPN